MEQIDRTKTANAIYPALAARLAAGTPLPLLANAVAAAAEGYPFPTNLDRDQPVGGLTPLAQTDIVLDALVNGVGVAELSDTARRLRGPATDERDLIVPSLQGKVVLVSGGTQGVGAGVARAAAGSGATRRCHRPPRGCGRASGATAEELGGDGAWFLRADVADVAQAQDSVRRTVERYRAHRLPRQRAGLTTRGTLLDTTPELFDAHVAVNLRAPFFLMQAAVADMVRRRSAGTIVNIITMSAHGGPPYLAPYVAAKAGLIGLTRNAAHAHRWDRIRINGVNIGWTETEGEDQIQRTSHGAQDDWLDLAATSVPMGKLGQVDEIAEFVVFLLSERSGVVTGSIIDWDQTVVGAYD